MTKICHMTSAHSSNDVRIFQKECVSLAEAGYDTYLVAKGESREERGVHVVGIGSPKGGRLMRMTQFSRAIYASAISLDADIYHLHDPELLPYGLKLQRKGKKVIFDSHENTLNYIAEKPYIPVLFRQVIHKCYRAYAVKCFAKYDALISVTPHIVDELKTINPNTWQITNYPIVEPMMNHEPQRSQEFTLCFTGKLGNGWGQMNIVCALNNVENVNYVICGVSTGKFLTLLKGIPGWRSVSYLGRVSHEEAIRTQMSSDVGMALLEPSLNTANTRGTIGNTKLFEYMMSGLPVICTNFTHWKGIMDKYECGICVNVNDVSEIQNAIMYLRDHRQDALQMGINGRRAVEEEFNWATQKEILLDVYEHVYN